MCAEPDGDGACPAEFELCPDAGLETLLSVAGECGVRECGFDQCLGGAGWVEAPGVACAAAEFAPAGFDQDPVPGGDDRGSALEACQARCSADESCACIVLDGDNGCSMRPETGCAVDAPGWPRGVDRYVKVVANANNMVLLDFRAIDTEGEVIPLTVVEYCSQVGRDHESNAVANAFDQNDGEMWHVTNGPGCRNGLPQEGGTWAIVDMGADGAARFDHFESDNRHIRSDWRPSFARWSARSSFDVFTSPTPTVGPGGPWIKLVDDWSWPASIGRTTIYTPS
ncbi:MAG: hypothetical protein QF382_04870, partial [Acidimicrobiales bacterium]|nr:hypothetical protein [Acidimicrobiales bacterium]